MNSDYQFGAQFASPVQYSLENEKLDQGQMVLLRPWEGREGTPGVK